MRKFSSYKQQNDLLKKILLTWLIDKFKKVEVEYRFCKRKWKFDYAIPDKMIAIEVEGGIHIRGRHTRGAGYEKDCQKYNQATKLGWHVYRFTYDMLKRQEYIDLFKYI